MKKTLLVAVVAASGLMLTISCFAQGSAVVDNARIVEMSKLGLGDDVIIARIKTSQDSFALGDSDLATLTKAGVSGKVIAAMLESTVLTSPVASIDGHQLQIHTLGESKVGGRIGHHLTFGIKSVKLKAFLPGKSAPVQVGTSPKLSIEIPSNDTIDNYLLVRMDKKDDRRELEVASGGGVVGSKAGIRDEAIQKVSVKSLGGNRFEISPKDALKPGEYFLYIVGSVDSIHDVWGKGFDFGVSE